MDDIKVVVGIFGGAILLVVALFIVIGLLSAPLEYLSCKEQAELNTELEYEWLFWGGGCRVRLPSGLWIKDDYLDEYQKNLLIDGLSDE